jgi:putative addiction module killer protein
VFEVRRYRTSSGVEPFTEWVRRLPDRNAQARIQVRLARLEAGNFGDCRYLHGGVSELRIDYGPGYRIYFGRDGQTVVMLLCGGDKRRQDADIERAVRLWHDYEKRKA